MAMTRTGSRAEAAARSFEFVRGALAQRCPARQAKLAGHAVKAAPDNPHSHALVGHLTLDRQEANVSYVVAARLCETWREPAPAGLVPGIRLALAAREFARRDYAGAMRFLAPVLGGPLRPPLAVAVERLALGAAAGAGDVVLLKGLMRTIGPSRHPIAWPWLGYVAAALGSDDPEPALFDALALSPDVTNPDVGGVSANPAYVSDTGSEDAVDVVRAAVMPGLAKADVVLAAGRSRESCACLPQAG